MYIIKKNNTCMYDDDNDITNMVLVWCGVVFMLLHVFILLFFYAAAFYY